MYRIILNRHGFIILYRVVEQAKIKGKEKR
jgi:hypothetical protein